MQEVFTIAAGIVVAVLALPIAVLAIVGVLAALQSAYMFIRYSIFGDWFQGWGR